MVQTMLNITTTKDAKRLALLNKEVQELHAELYPEEFKPYDPKAIEKAFEEMLSHENAFAFLAAEGDNVLGYMLCFIKTRKENAFQYEKTVLYIDQIGVHISHRGKGVGSRLLERADELAREKGITQIELDHWRGNTLAEEFFGKKGFKYFKHLMRKGL